MTYIKLKVRRLVELILAWASRRILRIKKPFIIGVTGTAGKTTTKSAIYHVLSRVLERTVRSGSGNLNTEIGLPLAILDLQAPTSAFDWLKVITRSLILGVFCFKPSSPEVLVLEYGIDHPGDMKNLLKIARPKIGVITNIGFAHTQFLKTIEAVAKEKGQLVTSLPKTGLAILNKRDRKVMALKDRVRARVVLVDRPSEEFGLAVAAAVAEHGFGIPTKEIVQAQEGWVRPAGRLNFFNGVKGSTIIDDTYNANPISTTLALNQLRKLAKEKKASRKIAVLADMLELGQEEYRAHKGVALLAQKVADEVVLVGTRFRRVAGKEVKWFAGPRPVAAYLLSLVKKGDIILVKGSQSMRMEKVVEALLKSKKDASYLVRQSSYWKNKPYLTP